MAESTELIAANVASTVEETSQPNSPSTKRRQPSTSPQPSKRQRLSTGSGESPSTIRESPKAAEKPDPSKLNGKNTLQEERKRGQRLFGGLLSTLSQSSTGTHQKRRQDIEKRQQEKAQRQKLEDEGRRQEKLHILKELRTHDMISFEEQSMRLRHSRMLATAQFLHTKTKPKIYYKPWQLRDEEASRIEQQIIEADLTIARELAEFASQKAARQPKSQARSRPTVLDPAIDEEKTKADKMEGVEEQVVATTKGEKVASPLPPDSLVADSSTNDADVPSSDAQISSSKDINNHEGEVVLEAAEDTVIY